MEELTMEAIARQPGTAALLQSPAPVLYRALQPGVVLLGSAGQVRGADPRALTLLGCNDLAGLAERWAAILPRLEAQGLRLPRAGRPAGAPAAVPGGGATAAGIAEIEVPVASGGSRRLTASLVAAGAVAGNDGDAPWGALLVQDADLAGALECDLRAASQMRSLAQITPAVAHDLRAPINAMVLNLEVLKETLAASSTIALPGGSGRDPRERQKRYVQVLREELTRLHQSLELFLAHLSPRGERLETLDLREPARDLGALLRPPARKQQAQIEVLVPDTPVPILTQRYLLRQALLHLGLAALAPVPRDGTLEIRLDRLPGRCRLRLTPIGPAGAEVAASEGVGPLAVAAAAEPLFSAAGTEARLLVAQSILSMFDGAARLIPAPRGAAAEAATAARQEPAEAAGTVAARRQGSAFEIEFPVSEAN
jgi:signal transduction histidine kinase